MYVFGFKERHFWYIIYKKLQQFILFHFYKMEIYLNVVYVHL